MDVNRSVFGYLMYVLDAITLVLITLFAISNGTGNDLLSGIGDTTAIILVFGSICMAMIFGIVDIKKTTEKATEIVLARMEEKK